MESLAERWLQGFQDRLIYLPQCTHCQRWNWYPLPACAGCQCGDFVWQGIAPVGKIYSWTRVHRNFTRHDLGSLPYVVCLVEPTAAPGVRIPCRFPGDGPCAVPCIDAEVVLEPVLAGADSFWLICNSQPV